MNLRAFHRTHDLMAWSSYKIYKMNTYIINTINTIKDK
jgi:hypothetical protein